MHHPHLEIAIMATQKAGEVLLAESGNTTYTTKTDGSPITHADIHSHQILSSCLAKTSIEIFSEESDSSITGHAPTAWIIDPLDGTKGFISGSGDYCIMVALLESNSPTLSVIYFPHLDILYYAVRGKGAWKIHQGIHTPCQVPPQPAAPLRCVRSVNHVTPPMLAVIDAIGATTIPKGSIGMKTKYLLEGDADFFFSFGSFPEWDVCAADLLIHEAGGVMRQGDGNAITYGTGTTRGLIASHPLCQDILIDTMKKIQNEVI